MDEKAAAPAAAAEGAPPKRHRLAKLVIVLAVAVAIVLVFLPYLVPTSWIASAAEQGLQSSLKRPVQIGKVSWGWLSGVTVRDVRVSELEEYGGGEFLSVSALSLKVKPLELVWSLGKKVTVDSIVIKAPRIVIVRARDGSYNVQNMSGTGHDQPRTVAAASVAAAAAEPELTISVRRVRLEDGAVTFKDLQKGTTVEAGDINAAIDADFTKPMVTGSADVSLSVLQAEGKGRVVAAAESFQVDRKLGAEAVKTMSASGTIRIEDVQIAEVLAAAASELGRDVASGKASIDLDYTVADGKIELKGRNGAVKSLVLGTGALSSGPVAVGDVAMSFALTASQTATRKALTVSDMNVRTDFAELTLSGPMEDVGGVQSAAVKASGSIDPSRVPKGLLELPAELETAGSVSFQLDIEGDPTPRKFSVTVDAGPMGLRYAGSLDKKAGTAAKLTLAGAVTGPVSGMDLTSAVLDVQNIAVDLTGGTLSASAVVDLPARSATWKGLLDFKGVDLADYIEAREKVVCAGRLRHSGQLSVAGDERRRGAAAQVAFEDLTVDLPSRPGTELALKGDASISSASASTNDLVVTLSGSPLTINALVTDPFTKPAGKITVRGPRVNADDLSALAGALTAAAPGEAAKPPAGAESARKPPAGPAEEASQEAWSSVRKLLADANVDLDVRIDTVLYEGYQGKDLVVDAGLAGGKALVRNSSISIFSGTVSGTSTVDLTADAMPAQGQIVVAALQSNEPVRKLLSKYLPGLDFSGIIGVSLSGRGEMGGPWEKASKSLTGGGSFEIVDGVLALVDLPTAISRLVPADLNLKTQLFSKLQGRLKLVDGFVESDYVIAKKGYDIFVEGKTSFAGDYTQSVGFVPEKLGKRVRLVTIENGRPHFEDLAESLLKLGAAAALQAKPSGGEGKSREQQVLEIIGGLIGGGDESKPTEQQGEKAPAK